MNEKSSFEYPDYPGISLIPMQSDSKIPIGSWKKNQEQIIPFQRAEAVAAIMGYVSGNMECIDIDLKVIDNHEIAETTWREFKSIIDNNMPKLFAKLVIQNTKNKGKHIFYRCEIDIPGNHVIAKTDKKKALFETRGEGGYVMVYPTKDYTLEQGDFYNVPTITVEERQCLMDCARSFNAYVETQSAEIIERVSNPDSPWSDYNKSGDPIPVLQKHGWTISDRRSDGAVELIRPGKQKDEGISATWNHKGERYFYCFSSNAEPFEGNQYYRAAQVFAMLECNNSWSVTAEKLKALGFKGSDGKGLSYTLTNAVHIEQDIELGININDGIFSLEDYNNAKEIKEVQLLSFDLWNHHELKPQDTPILTKTNLFLLVANQGFGKTSIMSSIASQVFRDGNDRDSIHKIHFKLDSRVKRILYYDSELKDIDAKQHYMSMARRLGFTNAEVNWETQKLLSNNKLTYFQAMKLVFKNPTKKLNAQEIIEQFIKQAIEEEKPYDLIIIDDVSCLVDHAEGTINNSDACMVAAKWLNITAHIYNLGFICTLHGNPGDMTGEGKGRGHLGSELGRFCETSLNLSMKRDEELYKIVVGYAGKLRRGGIFQLHKNPLYYYYDEVHNMLLGKPCDFEPEIEIKETKKQAKIEAKIDKKYEKAERINHEIRILLGQLESTDSIQVKKILNNFFPEYAKITIDKMYQEWKEFGADEFSIYSRNGSPDTIKLKKEKKPNYVIPPIKESLPKPEADEFEKGILQSIDKDEIDFDTWFND